MSKDNPYLADILASAPVIQQPIDDVDPARLWKDVQEDIPHLIKRVEAHLAKNPPEIGPR